MQFLNQNLIDKIKLGILYTYAVMRILKKKQEIWIVP